MDPTSLLTYHSRPPLICNVRGDYTRECGCDGGCLVHTLAKMAPSKTGVVGRGFGAETVRTVSAGACRHLCGIDAERTATVAHGTGVAEGTILGLCRFDGREH